MLQKLGRLTKLNQDLNMQTVPSGQYVTDKFPVLTFGNPPDIDLNAWRFRVFGLVEEEIVLDWEQFANLHRVIVESEFHCVTQWSRMENVWEGVAFKELMNLVKPAPEAEYVMVHCYGGYTTNLSLEVLQGNDVLFACRHDNSLLTSEHGGPLRLVVPSRYGWKSAKWVNGLEFIKEDSPGFWEQRGYHMEGDPCREQRFS